LIDGAESHWGDELCDESADELDIELYGYHCFVAYEGRYYDSEEPTGVDNFQDLPCFSRGVP
jgi:hypothetical protein